MYILWFFPKFTLVESRINWGPVVAPLSLCWQNCIIFLLFYLQVSLITKIRKRIADGHRVLIHCYGGLGRAVLVAACLVMTIDEDVFTDEVRQFVWLVVRFVKAANQFVNLKIVLKIQTRQWVAGNVYLLVSSSVKRQTLQKTEIISLSVVWFKKDLCSESKDRAFEKNALK